LEERRVGLVDLRIEVAEHFLQPIALHRTRGRRKPRFGLEVRKILNDRRALREDLSICVSERSTWAASPTFRCPANSKDISKVGRPTSTVCAVHEPNSLPGCTRQGEGSGPTQAD